MTCKQRHVRCDEVHPVCGHCSRLDLACRYSQPHRRRGAVHPHSVQTTESFHQPTLEDTLALEWPPDHAALSASDLALDVSLYPWSPSQTIFQSLLPACENQSLFADSCVLPSQPPEGMFPSIKSPRAVNSTHGTGAPWDRQASAALPAAAREVIPMPSSAGTDVGPVASAQSGNLATQAVSLTPSSPSQQSHASSLQADAAVEQAARSSSPLRTAGRQGPSIKDREKQLLAFFNQVVQPPAAILIGGVRKWRCLQRYLVGLGLRSQTVFNALLCVTELLAMANSTSSSIERSIQRHQACRDEMQGIKAEGAVIEQENRDTLLAALFLLAWFEVIHDRHASSVGGSGLFPQHLANWIIINNCDWNQYSRQLLSWFYTLDTKATHLGGAPLLSPETLKIVAHYPTQIACTNIEDEDSLSPVSSVEEAIQASSYPVARGRARGRSRNTEPDPIRSPLCSGYIKRIILQTMVQPAIDWYSASQLYCRRISEQDKHHRTRFTPDDEYEVVTNYKHLERELWQLWRRRPTTMSLTTEELSRSLPADVAFRLTEIFCVHLASFWILFVYLHRVTWWALPHSLAVRDALDETWYNLRGAYGEVVDDGKKRICHPALLWPLFLFGSECPDSDRRTWAIEQLEALGELRPVLVDNDAVEEDPLPPFRRSWGATLNARRAAVLLRELVKRQMESQARVDFHDLSMELFSCYFSIV